MHWKDFGQWGMAECIHNLVLITTKHMVQKANFFPLVVMRSQLLITKVRFQSMVTWLKIGGRCPYF